MAKLLELNELNEMENQMDYEPAEEETELTEDEKKAVTRSNEKPLLDRLLSAAEYVSNEEHKIYIRRNHQEYFSFSVTALSEKDLFYLRDKYTKVKMKRGRRTEEFDTAKYRCSVIYNSTVDRDKAQIWDNRDLWEALRTKGYTIINALDVVEALLLPGEKAKVVEALDEFGGYNDEDSVTAEDKDIQEAKN